MPNNDNKVKKEKKHFFKNFRAELKKVIWPTPKQLVNNTVAVLVIVLITTVIVFALDFVFENLNTNGINKIKELVGNSISTENVENTENTENTVESEGTVDDSTEANTTAESSAQ